LVLGPGQGVESRGSGVTVGQASAIPGSYRAAVEEIERRLRRISESVESAPSSDVSHHVQRVIALCQTLGGLAGKPGSEVPSDFTTRVPDLAAKLIASMESLKKTKSPDESATPKQTLADAYSILKTLLDPLPLSYRCAKRCEEEKTYPQSGKCAKCGSDLVRVVVATVGKPRHGGILVTTNDGWYSAEATISPTGEFRLYLYDDFLEPLTIGTIHAAGRAWKRGSGKETRRPLTLVPGPAGAYLLGRVEAAMQPPMNAQIYVNFQDGKNPYALDFQIDKNHERP